jgi:oxygen-independent coproporphyrinogen-3 oxidase
MPSVYIHIPFCVAKCPYCDFYSRPLGQLQVPDAYVVALCRDIRRTIPHGTPVRSVFVGGGTPSLLRVEQLKKIVAALDEVIVPDPDLEFSIEVNPATTSPAWLGAIRALGINRISIGVQSFQEQALRLLGRRHSGSAARECVRHARKAGFANVNIDMMFALPWAQDAAQRRSWMEADMETLADLHPEHVSVYGLTLEQGTPFAISAAAGDLREADEDEFCYQFMAWHRMLDALGYQHYEISNYARQGYACRHNLAYWQRQDCYACGAGAHAFNSINWGVRCACRADVDVYISSVANGHDPREVVESFDLQSAMSEWVYLRLRTANGVDEDEFRVCFEAEFAEVYAPAIQACGRALVHASGRWYFPVREWLLYNHLVQQFLI